MLPLVFLILAYLLGSIPFGLMLMRAAGRGDLRKLGSGNIGATNVLRTGNKKLALLTLLLDVTKGYAAVWLGYAAGAQAGNAIFYLLAASILAVLGHVFPIWLRGHGGKGVATILGTLLALCPFCGLLFLIVWVLVFAATRYSSLAALSAMGAVTVTAAMGLYGDNGGYVFYTLLTFLLLIYTHRSNIQRLLNGTEHRFSGAA